MSYFFLYLAVALAVLDWVAVFQKNKPLEYFAKPAVMVALLAWLWQVGGLSGPLVWFAVGLLFSMAGDVFLMLPRERFIAGLISFLLAHVAYLVGFNANPPPLNAVSLIIAVLVGAAGQQIFRQVAGGLQASGKTSLKLPVMIYSAVISLMLISALFTLNREEWSAGTALLASGGALLFFMSDTFLAWNKFVAPLPFGKLRVIITYHLGQALIVLGAALHFLNP